MRKTLYALLCTIGIAVNAQAQKINPPDSLVHLKSIAVIAGTPGVGAEFKYGLIDNLALRIGGSILPVTLNNAFPVSGLNSNNTLTTNFSNIHLLADFTPFKSAPFFRLVGGAAYFVQAKGDFVIQPTDSYTYGAIVLTPDEVGKVTMDVVWKGFAPYLGLGLVKLFPRNKFNVNLDLGSYYLSSPQTSIVGTGLLDGNSSQNAQLQKNLSGYRFLPVLQLNFNYKL